MCVVNVAFPADCDWENACDEDVHTYILGWIGEFYQKSARE